MPGPDDLRALGYAVELAQEGGRGWANPESGSPVEPPLNAKGKPDTSGLERVTRVAVYHVEGFGISTYLNEDDADAWASLVEHHDEVERQHGETIEETRERQAREGVLARTGDGTLERVEVEDVDG